MPNLQKLASEGIILEQHYSQPVCTPTRGAILTGRYPIHTGLNNGMLAPMTPYGLDEKFTLLPQELKRNEKQHLQENIILIISEQDMQATSLASGI